MSFNSSQAIFTVSSGTTPRIFTKKCWKSVCDGYIYCHLPYFFSLRWTDRKYQISLWGIIILRRSIVVMLKTSQESKILVSDPKALHHIMIKVSLLVYISHVLKWFLRTSTHTKWRIGSQCNDFTAVLLSTKCWLMIVSIRSSRILFGPGLAGSLGKFCQPAESFPLQLSNYRRCSPKAEENVESRLFHCSHARDW